LIYYYNLFFMSRYERMDCIKRSMMPVRYKKIGSGETYLLLEALFFTSAEPVDKNEKNRQRRHEAWEGHQQAPASGCPSRSLVTAETVKVWTWSGGAGGFSNEERRAGGWPGFRKGVVPAGNGKQETPYGDESVRG
ncbi:hypothetical protein, partial [Bilophila wadsworthia]|uniref:hypothetical protein n=1 Tax=Bilophila wadsworthia TaxID=35833 RepID=UPI003AB397A8